MRRLVGLTVLVFSLAVPTVALPFAADTDDGTLSVKAGIGRVNLNFNGAVVGRLGHGRIVATDPFPFDGSGVDLWGCEKLRNPSDQTTVCSGNDIRFRAIGGRYQISIRGSGISLSLVGHGTAGLEGRTGNEGGSDGVYSLNDNLYRSLPSVPTTFDLIAPPGS
ncbi:MAG TPA: hypothetical protein VF002_01705 [Gaiellaceae bacterium]